MPDPPLTGIPDGFEPLIALDDCFDAVYGLELLAHDGDTGAMSGRVAIRDEVRQQSGLLHGGVISALAEALASRGTWLGAGGAGVAVMGMSNDTSFLRPFTEGHVTAAATPRHRGATRWLWEVVARDDQDRVGAITMVNIAIRPRR